MALIAVFFVFQNGTCSQQAVTSTNSASTGTTTITGTTTTLALTASSSSVALGGTLTFTASGGTSPYTYAVLTGGGTFSNSSSGVYTAPNYTTTAIIGVTDANGATQSTSITVGSSSSGITLTPQNSSVAASGTVQFTATGGTAPYTYYALGSLGTFSSSVNGLFQAGTTSGTMEVEVVDSLSLTQMTNITVTGGSASSSPTPPPTVLSTSFSVPVDQYFAVTYTYSASTSYPYLVVFGTSPAYGAGANCNPVANAAPCVNSIPLSNWVSTVTTYSYRGIISFTGRNGSSNLEYCINPSDPTKAYIKGISGNGLAVSTRQFLSPGLVLFNGASATTGLVNVDSSSGAGSYSTTVTGQYSVHADCSDLAMSSYIQVQPW